MTDEGWHLVNRYPVPAPRWNLLVSPDGATVRSLEKYRLRKCVAVPGWGCLVMVYSGIRLGVIAVASPTSWWPITPEGDAASWRIGNVDGTTCELIRYDLDGTRTTAQWNPETGLRTVSNSASPKARAWDDRLVSWDAPGGQLEGMLATPRGTGPWPMVVYLHGGPWFGIDIADEGDAAYWTQRAAAFFRPDYSGSGILGEDPMWEPLRGLGMPDRDLDADGVLAGVRSLVDKGIADPDRLYLYGFSAGGYLTNRIITRPHPFAAAASWEGAADPRQVPEESLTIQVYWRGCTPDEDPDRWAAVAPVTHAARVKVPVTILAGQAPHHPALLAVQRSWHRALQAAGVKVDLHEFEGQGHVFDDAAHQSALKILANNWRLTAPRSQRKNRTVT